MMSENKNIKKSQYDRFSRFLHWSVAIGIIYASMVGYALHFISSPKIFDFFSVLNMSMGSVVTVLMLIRYVWKFFRPNVPYPQSFGRIQKGMVVLMHEIFYLIIFVVLVTGFLMLEHSFSMFGIWHIPQPIESITINRFFFTIHRYACVLLVTMLVIHVLAVVKHSFMGNKDILKRMV